MSRKSTRDSDDDDSQKTRRVNPLRLAARLGADIVAEMEAFIYPGAKMPTFEVRRDIQERYAGPTETAPTPGEILSRVSTTEIPPMNELQPVSSEINEKQPVTRISAEIAVIQNKAVPVKFRTLKRKIGLDAPEQLSARNAKKLASERISELKHGTRRHTHTGGTSNTAGGQLPNKKRRRIFTPPVSRPGDDSNPRKRTPSPCPEFALLDEKFDSHSQNVYPPNYHPSSEFYLNLYDVAAEANLTITQDDYQHGTFSSIEEDRPLSEEERSELYNLINNNIGVFGGIEECAGTYAVYMKEQSRLYFDRISFKTNYGRKIFRATQGELCSSTSAMGDDLHVDFQKWLASPDKQERFIRATQAALAPSGELDSESRQGLENYLAGQPCSEVLEGKEAVMDNNNPYTAKAKALYYDYDVNLSPPSALTLVDESTGDWYPRSIHSPKHNLVHYRRHSNRAHLSPLLPTPLIQSETSKYPIDISSHNSSTLPSLQLQTAGFMDAYLHSPDCQNAIRSRWPVSRPTRLRTTSAGGGI
ncbi:hypothetical protein H0H81_012226 [Sphagnurus paluster]|uniref:Uncharacterized protein n=1 Tax=Sphagnurus paluster TaxID=117069 RepID=A0A9P7K837_9AGAR|nr:hypothetical protein H0H81_012226 [Sphagnurus paluster]